MVFDIGITKGVNTNSNPRGVYKTKVFILKIDLSTNFQKCPLDKDY